MTSVQTISDPPAPGDRPRSTFAEAVEQRRAALTELSARDRGRLPIVVGIGVTATATVALATIGWLLTQRLPGSPSGRTDVLAILAAALCAACLVAVVAIWSWYTRDWPRVRRLRLAWERSLRTPAVRALPSGTPPRDDADLFRSRTDPRVIFPVSYLDRVPGVPITLIRLIGYPQAALVGLIVLLTTVGRGSVGQVLAIGLPASPIAVAGLSAGWRAWSELLVRLPDALDEADDFLRWNGWRALQPGRFETPDDQARSYRLDRLRWQTALARYGWIPVVGVLAISLGALVAGVATVPTAMFFAVFGVFAAVVGGVQLSHPVRAVLGRRRTGSGIALRVLVDDVPALGPTALPAGPAALKVDAGLRLGVHGGEIVLAPDQLAGLISGAPRPLRARQHWLVLTDGSQLALACPDVTRLRETMAAAGIRVIDFADLAG